MYLWAGRVEWAQWLFGTAPAQNLYDPFPAYFSGAPVIYPPLAAMANSIGGLAGARLLSLCFMLLTTGLLYGVTRRLFGEPAAIFSTAIFVATGSTQYLGAFATYDAMALMLLALATWLGIRSAEAHRRAQVLFLLAAAGALALADATKYASVIFDPVVIAVITLAVWRRSSPRNAVAATAIVLSGLCGLLFIGLAAGGHVYWHGIQFTTLARASGTDSGVGVLFVSGRWVGGVAFLAVIGALVAAHRSSAATKLLGAVLGCAVFIAPMEQARIHTVTSLFKHVDFGAWFSCIVAGYALASLSRAVPVVKVKAAAMVATSLVILIALSGFGLSRSHFALWPNSARLINAMRPIVSKTHCPCLFASDNVADYYLPQQMWPHRFTTVYYFYYLDTARARLLHGTSAYRQAITDRYFSLIEIDPSEEPQVYLPIVKALKGSANYKLEYRARSNIPGKPFEIWLREKPAVSIQAATAKNG